MPSEGLLAFCGSAGFAAAYACCLLIASLLARNYSRAMAARLGGLFALGTAAYAVCSAPGLHAQLGWWAAPILALATGNNVMFWLFA